VESASSAPKAARESGVRAASAPPVTTASASPWRIARIAVPIASAPDEHAETVPNAGPRRPWRMLSAAAAALPIISGTASGDTCLGPWSNNVRSLASIVPMPPMPVPMIEPIRPAS